MQRLRLADQDSSQGNVLRRNLSDVYPGIEEKTHQLTYCQKFPNLKTQALHSNESIELEYTIIISKTIPNTWQN